MVDFRFCDAMNERRIIIAQSDQRPHFFRSFSAISRRFNSALAEFLELMPKFEITLGHGLESKIIGSFELLCYRAAELAEVFEGISSHIPALKSRKLKSELSSYHSTIKRHFRQWNLICNRIEHNSNQMFPIIVRYDTGQTGIGFTLFFPTSDNSLGINHDFHAKGQRCMAFTRALNQLIFDISKADQALARLVKSMDDDDEAELISLPKLKFIDADQLEKVMGIQHIALLGDTSAYNIPHLDEYSIRWEQVTILPPSKVAQVSMIYTADGMTRKFPII